MPKERYETVHYSDFDDTHIWGVADVNGIPGYFIAPIGTNEFCISPVAEDLCEMAKEYDSLKKRFIQHMFRENIDLEASLEESINRPRDEKGFTIPYLPFPKTRHAG